MNRTESLAVIILTFNEEANLPECLRSVCDLEAQVFVVDSGSTDRTLEIARAKECHVVEHPFENYAAQRNWAFDNLAITAAWTLCLDADERLTPELAAEISSVIDQDETCNGYILRKRTIFMGRWLRFGGQYPAYHLRLFRTGRGRCEQRLYDQHFVVDGLTRTLESDYIDILTDSLDRWIDRHNRWASLEATELLNLHSTGAQVAPRLYGSPIQRKRYLRTQVYYRFPLFVRPFLLWSFDYIVRLGFLDGIPGLIFHTMQRFWFRFLIDAKVYEMLQNRKGRGPDA